MKIALAQLNPTIGDLQGNAAQILAAAQSLNDDVDLLLTPELSLCGYPPRDLLLDPGFMGAALDRLHLLATELPPALAVLVGLPTPAGQDGKPLHNSIALLRENRVEQVFHKQLLPTYDVFDENRYFQAGFGLNYFQVAGHKVGVTICEDLWNDQAFWGKRQYLANPIEQLAEQDVDLVVNLSASPYTVGKQQVREAMLQHLAQSYDYPIIYVNQVGANDDLIFDGGSIAFDRQGNLVGRGKSFEPDILVVEYGEDIQPSTIQPLIADSDAEIWQALVLGLRDYAAKCGFQRAVLGLSGGIDSALVAAIAVAALGAERVLGVLMPSPYSSDHSITDAVAAAKLLGIETIKLPIAGLMKEFDQALAPLFAETEFGIAEENIQSRIRGTLLMGISNKFGHLLLSTGNKSELAVGYCTLYGDMNGGLAAIADVPKTRVFSLCRWLNRDRLTIPEQIIEKPPSAELRPGQVDQDSLPPYDELDAILQGMICDHKSVEQLIQQGFAPETVAKIAKLVKIAEFKRRQAPPGLKITDRAFGTGWRMPIASRVTGY
jgi:NAD+ synthase (glutamine-hydrolysing)